jgi:hypothetical protein
LAPRRLTALTDVVARFAAISPLPDSPMWCETGPSRLGQPSTRPILRRSRTGSREVNCRSGSRGRIKPRSPGGEDWLGVQQVNRDRVTLPGRGRSRRRIELRRIPWCVGSRLVGHRLSRGGRSFDQPADKQPAVFATPADWSEVTVGFERNFIKGAGSLHCHSRVRGSIAKRLAGDATHLLGSESPTSWATTAWFLSERYPGRESRARITFVAT